MDSTEYDLLFKYILVGDASVGKSTLLGMFVDNKFREQNQPTLGVEFASRRVEVEGQIIKLQIWDTAGQQIFRTITRAYYKNTIGVILVFDVNVKKTFESVTSWLEEIREMSNPLIQIVLVANKTDIDRSQVTQEQIAKYGLKYFFTSAKTGDNINDPFMELTEKVLKRVQNGEIDTSDPKSGVKKSVVLTINRDDVSLKLNDVRSKTPGKQSSCGC